MDNISTFVGRLCDDSMEWRRNNGELFYFTHIDIMGYVVPAVMSRHFFDKYTGTRILCRAFPRETRIKFNGERQVFSYLYCVHVEEADPDTADCRDVEIYGVVSSRNSKVTLGSENDSKIHFEMEYVVNFDRPVTVLVPCRAFGMVARSLLGIQKGDALKVSGKISGYGQTLRLIIKKFDKEVEPNVVED